MIRCLPIGWVKSLWNASYPICTTKNNMSFILKNIFTYSVVGVATCSFLIGKLTSHPKTLFTMFRWGVLCANGGLFPTANSMYGHCGRYLTEDRFFWSSGRSFRIFNRSFRTSRRTGGMSGEMLMFLLAFLRRFAFWTHEFRRRRSTNRMITLASASRLRRWHAAKSRSLDSIPRWSRASWWHFTRVVSSSSSAAPVSPWIVRFHFLHKN